MASCALPSGWAVSLIIAPHHKFHRTHGCLFAYLFSFNISSYDVMSRHYDTDIGIDALKGVGVKNHTVKNLSISFNRQESIVIGRYFKC